MKLSCLVFFFLSLSLFSLHGQGLAPVYYKVSLKNAAAQQFLLSAQITPRYTGTLDLAMPKWTPGYYQLLNFAQNVHDLKVTSSKGNVEYTRLNADTWRIPVEENQSLSVHYTVSARENFIARPYIDKHTAFIRPTGVFLFPVHHLQTPVRLEITGTDQLKIATGLDRSGEVFTARDFDQLYDSPILIGELEEIPSFEVSGIPHYFVGKDLTILRNEDWSGKLQKMVQATTGLIGDIPYQHYTFIAVGEGKGGIEQTNSTAVALDLENYNQPGGKERLLNFLTHEYFHHFNVKRIRPIELGPFDYLDKNRTKMLWISEGLTVYFEDIILNRAGLKTRQQMFKDWETMLEIYENNPGKKIQNLAASSYETWEDGPFGIKGKTISPYEKGPVIGMLLDLKIRTATNNRSSLIDVMRFLYQTFYQEKNRGFTESEFREVCEQIAQTSLKDIFNYVYHTAPVDYNTYFNAAGLEVHKTKVKDSWQFKITVSEELSSLQKEIISDLFRID